MANEFIDVDVLESIDRIVRLLAKTANVDLKDIAEEIVKEKKVKPEVEVEDEVLKKYVDDDYIVAIFKEVGSVRSGQFLSGNVTLIVTGICSTLKTLIDKNVIDGEKKDLIIEDIKKLLADLVGRYE